MRASRGDLDEAQALLFRARRVAEVENARPAVRASAVANLGALRMLQRRYQDAEPLYRSALQNADRAYGPHDPVRGEMLANLAAFSARQREDATAEHLFVRALAALERIDARDPRRVSLLRGLASPYATQGRRAEAARIEGALAAPPPMLSRGGAFVPPAEEP